MKSRNLDPAEILRRAREMAHTSQAEAARLVPGVTQSQLSALERADQLTPALTGALLRKAADRYARQLGAAESVAHLNLAPATELALDAAALAQEHMPAQLVPDH
jgi:hypothetical protein